MPNRREFLQMSLAASALPALAGSTSPAPGSGQTECVVFESTSPLAVAFGEEARRLGLRSHSIRDDVTDLWYHELSLRWKQSPAAIAGITLSTSLFCLETLAGDHGMRVCFRVTHGPATGKRLDWGRDFAAFVAGTPGARAGGHEDSPTAQDRQPGPMVSWIIAPRLRS